MANEQVFYSALHWAKKAEASAKLAADLAQTEGKVIQLGFDGSMQDGQLVFKHAPGGVEVPYHLVDDVEYELDLAYNGDLDSLTTMVVKNGADNITFVSALHRSSTEPARVADMDAVMRHDTTTGYRWLFKATFKIAPNGAKVFLLYPVVAAKDYSDKTNCITEIPQDIKLELKDGVLTLKAGSRVYVPNGFEADGTTPKFDVIVTESDASISNRTTNTKEMLFYSIDTQVVNLLWLSDISSGTTQPTGHQYMIWYDTANNLCKFTKDSGVTWEKYSLPVSLVAVSSTQITSIDQVFNGFGYIGSTVFALPGVKGLIPDGRNADGSLRNVEFVVDKVEIADVSGWSSGTAYGYLMSISSSEANYPFVFQPNDRFYTKLETPQRTNETNYAYLENENQWYFWNIGATRWIKADIYTYGNMEVSNGVVTSLTPKLPFHAVDRNDSSWVAQQAMPSSKYIDLTLGADGASYIAPANGWFLLRMETAGWVYLFNNTSKLQQGNYSGSSVPHTALVEARRGDSVSVFYSGTVTVLRFVYCEGDK